MREDLAAVAPIELDDVGHGTADRERASDDCAGTGANDEVEALSEIEAFDTARPRELVDEVVEKSGRINAAHAAAVETQHPVWFDGGVGFFHCTFSDITAKK